MKTSEKERLQNRTFRTRLRGAIKAVRSETNKENAVKALKEATIVIDKAAAKNLIPKKTAARNKSRLAAYVNKLS
jgi:small subunit ribosomal protein S20